MPPTLSPAIPQLPSSDLSATQSFLRERLGFTDFRLYAPQRFLIARRAVVELHFWQADTPQQARQIAQASSCYIRVSGIESLYQELCARGAPFRYGLTRQPWGMLEMQVDDPDGNAIRWGQEIVDAPAGGNGSASATTNTAAGAPPLTTVSPRLSVLTLTVEDLPRAVAFYRDGLGWPTPGIVGTEFEHGAVAFFDLEGGLRLALWPRASLAADAGLPVQAASHAQAAPVTLGHNVASVREVCAVMDRAAAAGARVVKPAQPTFWGGHAGYFQDPDGHLWEVVFNPQWVSPTGA